MVLCVGSSEFGFSFNFRVCILILQECGGVRAGGGGRVLSIGQHPPCVQTPTGTAVPFTRFTQECWNCQWSRRESLKNYFHFVCITSLVFTFYKSSSSPPELPEKSRMVFTAVFQYFPD